jgi:hypothetical protein
MVQCLCLSQNESDSKEIVTNDPQFYNDLYAKYLNAEMIDFQ